MQSFGYTPPSFWTAIPPDRTVLSKYDAAKVRCRLLVARHQQALSPGQCDPRSARFPEMASASPVQVEWRQSVGRTNRRDPPAAGVPAHGGHPNIPSVRPDLNTAAHSYTHTLLPPQRQQCQPPPSAAAQKRGGGRALRGLAKDANGRLGSGLPAGRPVWCLQWQAHGGGNPARSKRLCIYLIQKNTSSADADRSHGETLLAYRIPEF